MDGASIGAGVSRVASSAAVSRNVSSSGGRQGWAGDAPATASVISATQSPSSWLHSSLGAGTVAGSAASTRASRRCMSGESGLRAALTAFTNTERPSDSRSTDANPGENPPGWLAADRTGAPAAASTAARRDGGRSAQTSRFPPTASGAFMPELSRCRAVPAPAFRRLCSAAPAG